MKNHCENQYCKICNKKLFLFKLFFILIIVGMHSSIRGNYIINNLNLEDDIVCKHGKLYYGSNSIRKFKKEKRKYHNIIKKIKIKWIYKHKIKSLLLLILYWLLFMAFISIIITLINLIN